MARLVAAVSLVVAALAMPAWAQNEGPCAFDYECGDLGKCVKANPEDTIGACALREGVTPQDVQDQEEAGDLDDSARAAAVGVEVTECRTHRDCAQGEVCYSTKEHSLKICAPTRDRWAGISFLTTTTSACTGRGQCPKGEACYQNNVTGEGLCTPVLTASAASRGRGQAGSRRAETSCAFDTECGINKVCYKAFGQITGTCGPERRSSDGRVWDGGRTAGDKGEKCFTDATCGYGFRCFKGLHEHEGVCGRSNSALGGSATFGGSWQDQQINERLRDMEQMVGRQCMQDRECGPGLRCATVRGGRECVLP